MLTSELSKGPLLHCPHLFICLFIYFWLCWAFVSVRGLSPVAASRGHSSSRCVGLSLWRPLLLRSTGSRRAGSVVVAHGPSCSAACGIFPDHGLEPVSPALAGRFSTTAPPGKPFIALIYSFVHSFIHSFNNSFHQRLSSTYYISNIAWSSILSEQSKRSLQSMGRTDTYNKLFNSTIL